MATKLCLTKSCPINYIQTNYKECLLCTEEPYIYVYNSTCVNACPPGSITNTDLKYCEVCSAIYKNMCVNDCPVDFYKENEITKKCKYINSDIEDCTQDYCKNGGK